MIKKSIIVLCMVFIFIGCKENIGAVNNCQCGENIYYCPEKALSNPENIKLWDDFCIYFDMQSLILVFSSAEPKPIH